MLKAACLWLRLCTSLSGPAYVIDGDTIIVQSQHIRLSGVDAEELNEPHGQYAKLAMAAIVKSSVVTCELRGAKSYDRYVGTCFVNGNDIGAEIIKQGFALDCAHYSGGKYRQFEPQDIRQHLIQKPYCR
jgi:micrococcal nuclease